jgi:hypothetical protein
VNGYVNTDVSGWTELRVHGVSGTPPESVLGHPHVVRVAGDPRAGFFRRRWEGESVSTDTTQTRLEAYSWGGLTAGSRQRALWLLLTPFLLANVAYWAQPDPGSTTRKRFATARRVSELLQRLFALSITLTMILAFVAVSIDFVGWQCVRPGPTQSCVDRVPWLGFLSWDWLDSPGRRMALGAVVPLALIGLLWWLANKTWRETEAVPVPLAPPMATDQTPLENRRMWDGTGPVRRLRSAHVTAALAVVGVFLLTPYARHWTAVRAIVEGGSYSRVALVTELLLGVALLLLAGTLVMVGLAERTDRTETKKNGERHDPTDFYRALPLIALAVDLIALVVLWLPGLATPDPTPAAKRALLPWFGGAVHLVLIAQIGLLVLTFVAVAIMLASRDRSADRSSKVRSGTPVETPAAWFGFGTPILMMFSSALGGGYAAGLVLTAAHAFGKPQPVHQGSDPFVVAMPYFWAAALSPLIAVVALALAAIVLIRQRFNAKRLLDRVKESYPTVDLERALTAPKGAIDLAAARRARRISRYWALAGVSDIGRRCIGAFVILLLVFLVAAVGAYVADPMLVYRELPWMVNVGDALVGLFVLGLLYLGRQAYRNPNFRRSVGVLWDLGTFWPRATHPLAPPCYAERAVPDLIRRISYLGLKKGGWVLLSCHSQGTVIGTAVVMQLTYEESSRVALLTYGSPLRRLYARFFPAYFGPAALLRAGAFLVGEPVDTSDGVRCRWPWRNLHRPSDPIGGAIVCDFESVEIGEADWVNDPQFGDNNDIDRRLVDPMFARPPGDGSYPQTLGHSAYFDDRAYEAAVAKVKALREAASPPPVPVSPVRPEPVPVSGRLA